MPDLIIFGRSGCQQSAQTICKAKACGLTFDWVDVDADIAAAAQLLSEGFRTLPVVRAGEQHWTGFRPDLLNHLEPHLAQH